MTRPADRRVVLFLHGADEWYGSDYVLFELVRALEGTEFEPVVVVPDDMTSELDAAVRLSARLRLRGVEVHALPLPVLRRRYMSLGGMATLARRGRRARREILRRVADRDVALVHSHTGGVLSGGAIARALRVPHVWHVSEIVERPAVVGRLIARRIARTADRVAAVSGAVRDHLVASAPSLASRTDVIYNGIDPTRFENVDATVLRARLAPGGAPLVGMIGRVGTWKGQELFLDAARDVARAIPNARFVLVGGVLDGRMDALDALRARAAEYGLADRVTIDGYTDDTPSYLAAMSVFVLPSLRPDPLPTTVLEAMASGRPVVAVRHGGAPEMVVDGVTGLLTPPGDADALAREISKILRDDVLREQMGAAGQARVRDHFSPAAFRSSYLALYRSLATRR